MISDSDKPGELQSRIEKLKYVDQPSIEDSAEIDLVYLKIDKRVKSILENQLLYLSSKTIIHNHLLTSFDPKTSKFHKDHIQNQLLMIIGILSL